MRMFPYALTAALAAANAVAAMDMDMHHGVADSSASPATPAAPAAPVEPTPHRAMHMHGVPILDTDLYPEERQFWEAYNTTSFLTAPAPHKAALYLHMAGMAGLLVFLQPIALVLNNVHSAWHLPLVTLNLAVLFVLMVCLATYGATAPPLYPNNAYSKMAWVLLVLLAAHFVFTLVRAAAAWSRALSDLHVVPSRYAKQTFELEPIHSTEEHMEPSGSIGLPSSTGTTVFDDNSNQSLFELDREGGSEHAWQTGPLSAIQRALAPVFSHPVVQKAVHSVGIASEVGFQLTNYLCWLFMFVFVPTGVVTVTGIAQGEHVFNVLAHFIKGGVFVLLGIVLLLRYSGAFASKGWAWNPRVLGERLLWWQRIQPQGTITMEMVESGLIAFYGCTNVFMERFASAGQPWSAKDLQHASIAFLYIGGGFCGLITEVKMLQYRHDTCLNAIGLGPEQRRRVTAALPGFSPNPFPLFTIYWTGLLMLKHVQALALLTAIHVQWGQLLCAGAAFRLATYVLLHLRPSLLLEAAKPITELITLFCLLAGGLIFMESTDPCILGMEYRGLTAMFTFNVSVGCVALLMAWQMLLLGFRDYLRDRRT